MAYYSKELLAEIKQIDLLTYLQNYEPGELVKINERMYTTREHDSLKISNGLWFWWSKGIGGRSALDFLVKVRGMDFTDAVEVLVNKTAVRKPIYSKPLTVPKAKNSYFPKRLLTTAALRFICKETEELTGRSWNTAFKTTSFMRACIRAKRQEKCSEMPFLSAMIHRVKRNMRHIVR